MTRIRKKDNHLAAAAPKLLAALKRIVWDADRQEDEAAKMGWNAVEVGRTYIAAARAAIAEAEGGDP